MYMPQRQGAGVSGLERACHTAAV